MCPVLYYPRSQALGNYRVPGNEASVAYPLQGFIRGGGGGGALGFPPQKTEDNINLILNWLDIPRSEHVKTCQLFTTLCMI